MAIDKRNGLTDAVDDKELNKAFLMGKHVYLRPFERQDVEGRWYQWFNDPQVTKYLKRGSFPNTYEQQLAFFEHISKSREDLVLAVVDRKIHKHIGVISLRAIDWIHRSADIAIIIGEADYRGGFYAVEAMALMTEHGFGRLNLNKIRASQHEDLDGWRKYLQVIGYQTEGVMKQEVYSGGRYWDVHMIAMFAEDYLRIKAERNGSLTGESIGDLVKDFLRAEKARR